MKEFLAPSRPRVFSVHISIPDTLGSSTHPQNSGRSKAVGARLGLLADRFTLTAAFVLTLGRGLFVLGICLERAQVVHQVPRLVGLQTACKGRHGRAIETGHKNAVKILI